MTNGNGDWQILKQFDLKGDEKALTSGIKIQVRGRGEEIEVRATKADDSVIICPSVCPDTKFLLESNDVQIELTGQSGNYGLKATGSIDVDCPSVCPIEQLLSVS